MSWLSKLGKGVVKGLQIGQAIAPIAAGFIPGGAAIVGVVNALGSSVLRAQATITAPGSGEEKAAMVMGDFDEYLADTRAIAQASGKDVVYDAAAVRAASDSWVTTYKLTADAFGSIRIVDKVKA